MTQIALCVTCIVDQIYPEIGVATVKLLRRAGYEVLFPAGQSCCGQPFFNSGFREQATELAKQTITRFAPYPAVVLPSGSCTAMIRVEYLHLLQDDPYWYPRAENLAAKTFELSQFLIHEAKWQPQGPAVFRPAITYHDSCHACRILGIGQEPRQLLGTAGYQLNEMAESDRCCGFGGLFSLRLPEISNAMSSAKLDLARQSQAPLIVTLDPGCLMQLRGLADPTLQIEHLATLLETVNREP